MKIRHLLAAILLLPLIALPQSLPSPAMNGTNVQVTATGATTARTLPARASDVVNVADYGATCDGVTDDAAAINAALAVIRARTAVSGFIAWATGKSGTLMFPSGGKCLVLSSLNATNLYGSGFVWNMNGAVLIGQTSGTPVVDATGTGQATFENLNIYGSTTNPPNIGLKIGRLSYVSGGADHLVINHPTITGYFTLAAFHNLESETTVINGSFFDNSYAGAYGAIWDGGNHFNVQSAFTGTTFPQDTPKSFNENTCIECIIGARGSGGVPIWLGGTARHKFINGYAYYSPALPAAATGPAVVLYFANSRINDFLDLDIHFEDYSGQQAMTSIIEFRGATSPAVHGLRMSDHYPEQNGPLFVRGSGVTSVTIQNADLNFGYLAGVSPSWWDDPAAYSVGGRIYSQDGTYIEPGTFSGTSCVSATCTNTIVLPSTLSASAIANSGGMTGITVGSFNNYGYGVGVPTCTVAAPPSGGQQATCSVTALSVNGYGYLDGTHSSSTGSGYTVSDVLTCSGGTLASGGTALSVRVLSVDGGGSITGFQGVGFATTLYTATPAEPCALTGGTGTGATLAGGSWKILAADVSIPVAGAGYTSAPAVTLGTAPCVSGPCGTSFAATIGTALDSTMTITAGSGKVALNATGTVLGVSGSSGSPVLAVGAFIDNSGVRESLGATYTVPANTSLVRFTQSGTVATSTVTLPTALADGQPIQFANYTGSITALTFSPSVTGWTNGSTLAANTGLRIRWDSTDSTWHREQ